MIVTLGAVAATSFGCYSEHERRRTVYEPAGSPREDRYYRDRGYYERNRYDRDYRYDEHHQWDNPNYRR